MNTSRLRSARAAPSPAQAGVDEAVRTLFDALPRLQGFSVQDAARVSGGREAGQLEGDLSLADIEVYPLSTSARDACFGEIAIAFCDLLEECPEARELLRDERLYAELVAALDVPDALPSYLVEELIAERVDEARERAHYERPELVHVREVRTINEATGEISYRFDGVLRRLRGQGSV